MSNGYNFIDIPSNLYLTPPYSFVCHLQIFNSTTSTTPAAYGNGVLISNNFILTSAHCLLWVTPQLKKEQAMKIIVTPAGGKSTNLGRKTLIFGKKSENPNVNAYYQWSPAWRNIVLTTTNTEVSFFAGPSREHDWGLIRLLSPFQLDFSSSKGIAGITDLSDINNLEICGSYYSNGQLRFQQIKFNKSDIQNATIVIGKSILLLPKGVDTSAGQSGSPVITRDSEGKTVVVASHSFQGEKTGRCYETLCQPNLIKSVWEKLNNQ